MPIIPADLPAPGAEALAHSKRVAAAIRDAIAQSGGVISFHEYMRLVLYAPGLGYYRAGTEKFGAAGDFVTAPEISPLFGKVVGGQIATMLAQADGDTVLELGAGSGRLALSVLETLAAAGRLPERYFILEISGELAARQRALLASAPQLAARVRWLARLPDRPIRGVVFANEVVDALPVERFRWMNDHATRLGVRTEEEGFAWGHLPAPTPIANQVRTLAARYDWPDGYTSELCPELAEWVAALASVLERGVVLLFDYGLPEREYYHPQRDAGTLICHYRHRAHDDPFLWPGLQDISAWVDFSALARAGAAAGLEVGGFTTQAHFLLGGGITDALAGAGNELERMRIAGEIKRLTLPSEMGEAFKALALVRDVAPSPAFGFRDFASRL